MWTVTQQSAEAPVPGEPAEPPEKKPKKKAKTGTRQVIEWVVLIGAALALALLIRLFLFQAFFIPSPSMVPTLKENDRVLVNKLSYKVHDVNRGDLLVFEAPESEDSDIKDLVKRVVALPGETVSFRGGSVYVDGKELDEDYLPEGTVTQVTPTPDCEGAAEVTIPPKHIWVMGDNRAGSKDSRCFGPIPESDIVGRVFFRMWPPGDIGFL